MAKELPKAYEPQKYEDEIYKKWEESGFFNPDVCVEKGICKKEAKSFSIMLPPPNATGSLHIGHAMMLAIEDLIIRYHRMRGDKTLWIPGTDHAAIATNAVVEKQLAKEGKTKNDLGREKYIERVKEYIGNSQNNIRNQVRKMGSSLDWSREAYTWDDERNLAVRTMFKKMYGDGLIYRGYRIVNWCPHCHSTLADDEVEYKEQKTKFYYFKYGPVIIGTARPETKFLDKTIIVHPEDNRYKKLQGKEFDMEWIGGKIKCNVIADAVSDPEFGTGAMTITPAHSFEDYELAKKYNLSIVQIIDEDGNFTEAAGEFAGKNAQESREEIVKILASKGLVDHIDENYTHNLSVCYRCKNTIEPLLSKQWFIDVNKEFGFSQSKNHPIAGFKDGQKVTLKKLMQQVVNNGQIEIIPERFKATYFHWIDNLRDWCISRQIWVGHQIPVWYRSANAHDKSEEIYVGTEAPKEDGWKQEADTLDTWFSSGLWTFSTLGWPSKDTKDLQVYHPTSVLETMFDILFFWVARMIMMSTYALGEIPFEKVYLHARVLDKDGEKMSKSKPETMIDPLVVCKQYGTDAVRLSLLMGITPGSDIRLSEDKIAGFRNFANKLWNIARFVSVVIASPEVAKQSSGEKAGLPRRRCAPPRNDSGTLADKWVLNRLNETIKTVTENIEKFNFSLAGEQLRDFTWNELADWYLEISKIEKNKDGILNYILETILKLWHPFMPFVTEQIWGEIYGGDGLLMVEKWPSVIARRPRADAAIQFGLIQNIITGIRSLRADYKIDPAKKLNVVISAGKMVKLLVGNVEIIKGLARLEDLKIEKSAAKSADCVGFVVGGAEVFVDLSGAVD
ncbi:MAG: valine--tRNA ligase, partial [Candidatus Magasanikbacteria bacterium]|nr:valine--tRNA ligase [Candidatus Magasanikbacteria bacterium]